MRAAKMKERPSFQLMVQTDVQSIYHMQMPRWLFSDPRYCEMSLDAKVTYTFLLNRFQLSRRNGWVNERGEVFVIFPRKALAKELRVVGLMNIQFAVKDGVVFILEVNPRASRTAPFVSKATGVPLPRLATQVMLGKTLKELDPWSMRRSGYVSVKESVFPFRRFPGVDILLGPEMRSTGEVMGIAPTFEEAFLKGQWGTGQKLPEGGKVFLSVNDRDKRFVAEVARQYVDLGFELLATSGTAGLLAGQGIPSTRVLKVYEGRPNIVDLIKNGEVSLVINTASGKRTAHDSKAIRQATLHYGVPYSTTLSGAKAIARAIGAARTTEVRVKSLQEYYKGE